MAKLITQIFREEIIKHKNGKPVAIKHATLVDTSKYTGEMLREIRKKHGVGRPPLRIFPMR